MLKLMIQTLQNNQKTIRTIKLVIQMLKQNHKSIHTQQRVLRMLQTNHKSIRTLKLIIQLLQKDKKRSLAKNGNSNAFIVIFISGYAICSLTVHVVFVSFVGMLWAIQFNLTRTSQCNTRYSPFCEYFNLQFSIAFARILLESGRRQPTRLNYPSAWSLALVLKKRETISSVCVQALC